MGVCGEPTKPRSAEGCELLCDSISYDQLVPDLYRDRKNLEVRRKNISKYFKFG